MKEDESTMNATISREEAMIKAHLVAGKKYNSEHDESASRFILHPKLSNPIPQDQKSLDIKLARKYTKCLRKDLKGSLAISAPRATVGKTTPTTLVIKEPASKKLWRGAVISPSWAQKTRKRPPIAICAASSSAL